VPIAALAVFVVLAAFLRALFAPLYLVATSLLALGASLGLTVIVFQDLLGHGELSFYVPFAGIVLLIALGSDYNVYLVGRIWSDARDRPFPEAAERAATSARRAITVAGVVLALSFALLAIVPLRPFRELAFLLTTGLLIDAFVVRGLLAPALVALAGERSAWPRRTLRERSTA
jgi:RND superfamily putative drug exporter